MLADYPGDGDSVTIGGETYAVEDGVVDLDTGTELRTLARRYGRHPVELRHDRCGEPIQSGRREGAPCDEPTPCQYHDN